jgi:hypothetical protein
MSNRILLRYKRSSQVAGCISKIVIYSVSIIIIMFLTSCGKKEVKPISEESRIAQEAFKIADTIRVAYLSSDRKTLEKNSTKDGYRELIGAIKKFDSAELFFTPTWVEIEGSTVNLTVSWKGVWIIGDTKKEGKGIAVFVLEGNPLKLEQVLRANPFREPE